MGRLARTVFEGAFATMIECGNGRAQTFFEIAHDQFYRDLLAERAAKPGVEV